MSEVLEIASGVIVLTGSLFCVIGGIGILRLPDLYSRTHAATITDTLGAGLMLLGLTLLGGFTLVTVKLILTLILLYVTSPTAAHALVKAAYAKGVHATVELGIEDRTGQGGAVLASAASVEVSTVGAAPERTPAPVDADAEEDEDAI